MDAARQRHRFRSYQKTIWRPRRLVRTAQSIVNAMIDRDMVDAISADAMLVERQREAWTVYLVRQARFTRQIDKQKAKALAALPELAESWRKVFSQISRRRNLIRLLGVLSEVYLWCPRENASATTYFLAQIFRLARQTNCESIRSINAIHPVERVWSAAKANRDQVGPHKPRWYVRSNWKQMLAQLQSLRREPGMGCS